MSKIKQSRELKEVTYTVDMTARAERACCKAISVLQKKRIYIHLDFRLFSFTNNMCFI